MDILLREERGADFWQEVLAHPEVEHVKYGLSVDLGPVLAQPNVLPLATPNGGWLFVQLDLLGRVFEIHAAYKPAGWGREAHDALMEGLLLVGADVVLVTETQHRMSKPPLSFGFRVGSEWRDSAIGPIRTWVLSRHAWHASPAYRRRH